MGTMQIGWSVDEPGSQAVMDTYAEAGGNFIDTADCYSSWSESMGGPPNAGGVSEEIIGRWMTSRRNRDDLVVATKVRGADRLPNSPIHDPRFANEKASRAGVCGVRRWCTALQSAGRRDAYR
jgi:aryl-alcohol dehydrogenase-like predicted oxidoreductase